MNFSVLIMIFSFRLSRNLRQEFALQVIKSFYQFPFKQKALITITNMIECMLIDSLGNSDAHTLRSFFLTIYSLIHFSIYRYHLSARQSLVGLELSAFDVDGQSCDNLLMCFPRPVTTKESECPFDYVRIYDGPDESSSIIATLCGR